MPELDDRLESNSWKIAYATFQPYQRIFALASLIEIAGEDDFFSEAEQCVYSRLKGLISESSEESDATILKLEQNLRDFATDNGLSGEYLSEKQIVLAYHLGLQELFSQNPENDDISENPIGFFFLKRQSYEKSVTDFMALEHLPKELAEKAAREKQKRNK